MRYLFVLLIFWAGQAYAAQGDIITIIGTAQTTTGQSMLANDTLIGSPEGIVLDAKGHVYFADATNHQIWKMNRTTGLLSVIAGTGVAGYAGDGGQATLAQLNHPVGLAFSPAGELYFADSYNHTIRKLNLNTGLISTVAGTGTRGFSGDGGAANLAQLGYPSGISFDKVGNLFIADSYNHHIRKVDSTGIITNVAGSNPSWWLSGRFSGDGGLATAAELNNPTAVVIDQNNNIYIADALNNRIRKVDSSGMITTIAGTGIAGYSGDGGAASLAQLQRPWDIALDSSGSLIIADSNNFRIRKIDSVGNISTIVGTGTRGAAGSGDGGSALTANLNYIYRIAVDTYSNLYLSDFGNKTIRMAGNVLNIKVSPSLSTDIYGNLSLPVSDVYGAAQHFSSLQMVDSNGSSVSNVHYQLPPVILNGSFNATGVNNPYIVPVYASDTAGGIGAYQVKVGYNAVRLENMGIQASPPDRVDVLVRAFDAVTGQPVANLKPQDFTLEEDSRPLSVESKVLIKKVTELAHTVQTVLMFDVSSSISPANLALMKQSVTNALIDPYTGLLRTKDQMVAIYTFDDTVKLIQDFTSNPTLVAQAIASVQQNVPAVTSTNLYGAILDGLVKATTAAQLTSLIEGHVIVMTDGRDTSGYESIYTTASRVTTSPNTLHLIGVQSPDLDPAVMKSLAKENYIEVASFSAVEQALTDIGAYTDALAYSYYQVYYNSPARAGQHYITIYEKHNNFSSYKVTGLFDTADFTPPAPESVTPSTSLPSNSLVTADQQPSGCISAGLSGVWVWMFALFGMLVFRLRQTTS